MLYALMKTFFVISENLTGVIMLCGKNNSKLIFILSSKCYLKINLLNIY